jgi:membrane protein implicated in regulation of membrane protease activity
LLLTGLANDLQLIMIIVWIAIFILAIIIELSTEQLVSIWFSGGAIVGMILAICSVPWYIQVLSAILVSGGLIALIQYILYKKRKNQIEYRTNVDAMIEQKIIVTKTCDKDLIGEGKYRDVYWSLVSDELISEGERAVIVKVEGNKLIVKKDI